MKKTVLEADMGRRLLLALLCVCLACSLCACGERIDAKEALCALLASSALPRGVLYYSSAAEGEAGYASESLLSALYGEAALSHEFQRLESFAIYSSGRMELCEVAVFCCYAASDADLLAKMCHARVSRLEKHLAVFGGEVPPMRVWVRGRWVFMAVSADAEVLMKQSGKAIAGR